MTLRDTADQIICASPGQTDAHVEIDGGLFAAPAFGRDDHDAVGSARSVNGTRSGPTRSQQNFPPSAL